MGPWAAVRAASIPQPAGSEVPCANLAEEREAVKKRVRGSAPRAMGRAERGRWTGQDVMIIATAAAVMTAKVAQPKYLSSGGFTRFPMTLWLLVRRMTSRIRGGARRPLMTADQNSILTALKPK